MPAIVTEWSANEWQVAWFDGPIAENIRLEREPGAKAGLALSGLRGLRPRVSNSKFPEHT